MANSVTVLPPSPGLVLTLGSNIAVEFVDGLGTNPDCSDNWTLEMKKAFLRATTVWENTLRSPVQIRIKVELVNGLGGKTLGTARPQYVADFPNAPLPGISYPRPLADMLAGYDLNLGEPDIIMFILSDCGVNTATGDSWNYEFGSVDLDEFSFITVVLHEIGHGMIGGSSTFLLSDGLESLIGGTANFHIMDQFLRDCDTGLNAQDLIDDPVNGIDNYSIELGDALQSNNLCWIAPPGFPESCIDELDALPKMHAPSFSNDTNSPILNNFSHMDEESYPAGNENALMTPEINPGEATLLIGYLFKCMLESMGWDLNIPQVEPDNSDIGRMHIGNSNNAFSEMVLKPNPSNDMILISLSENNGGLIQIINLTGQKLLELRVPKDYFEFSINISDLPEGIHLVNVISSNQRNFVEKLSIIH